MARLFASDRVGFDLSDFDLSVLLEGDDYDASSSRFVVSYDDGTRDVLEGRDFRFDDDGIPIGGTVTAYEQFDRSGALARLEGVSVAATDILDAALTSSTSDDLALFIEELSGKDRFEGGRLADTFDGYGGADQLLGDAGKDILRGGTGDDTITGGAGSDELEGGAGRDRFVFDDALGKSNVDAVLDFEANRDRLVLDRDVFSGLGGAGDLSEKAFQIGTEAADGSDRIIYNDNSGKLFFDPDGDGRRDAVLIAKLDADLRLDADDFLVR
jgi:Ca2+-binding RTX toxin-like protein